MTTIHPAGEPQGDSDSLSPAPRPGNFLLDRWQILQLVKDTSRATGIGEREIAVLVAHLSVLGKGPIRSDQLLISYAEIGGILDRANCMDERRFRRGEARLEKLGFVRRKRSANGRRFPIRNGAGQIVDAYGLDLRPLFLRAPELRQLHDAMVQEEARRNALRCRISARLSEAKRRAEAEFGCVSEDLTELAARVRNLLRRANITCAEMSTLESDVISMTSEAATTPIAEKIQTVPVALDGNRNRQEAHVPDKQPANPGQIVRHIEFPRKELKKRARQTSDERMSTFDLWQELHQISKFFPTAPTNNRELSEVLLKFSGFLGLRRETVDGAVALMDTQRLLYVFDYLAQRIEKIARPDQYFQTLVAKYAMGNAIADGKVSSRTHAPDIYDRGHNLVGRAGQGRGICDDTFCINL